MIREQFWEDHCEILEKKSPQIYEYPLNEFGEVVLPELVLLQMKKNQEDSEETNVNIQLSEGC